MRINWTVILIFLTILTLYLSFWLFILNSNYFESFEMRGQYGDMFGMLNAFFTALAFGGVIYTITMQQTQFRRQEIQLSETTFFQMLVLQNEIVKLIDYRSSTAIISQGRDCFRSWYSDFKKDVVDYAKKELGAYWQAEFEPPNVDAAVKISHIINIYHGIFDDSPSESLVRGL